MHNQETDLEKQTTFLSHIVDEGRKRSRSGDAEKIVVVEPAKALPPNSRHHLTSLYNDYLQTVEDRQFRKKGKMIKTSDDVLSLIGLVRYDQKLYDSLFHQIAQQADTESKPRGALLKTIRKRYKVLLNKAPRILRSFHQDLVDQQNIDKSFERRLQSGRLWWQKQLGNLRRTTELSGRLVAAIKGDLEQLTPLAVRHDEEADQLKNLRKLQADYRHHADQKLRKQTLVRPKWQDTVYLICLKMIKDQKLVKLTETHVVYQEWYHMAQKRHKLLRRQDKLIVSEVRGLGKVFLKALHGLDSFLLASQDSILGMLQDLKEEVDLFLLNEASVTIQHRSRNDREDVRAELRKKCIPWGEYVRVMVQNLKAFSNSCLPTRVENVHALFEQIVKTSLSAYLCRESTLQRITIPPGNHVGAGEECGLDPPASSDILTQEQFDFSKTVFAKILGEEPSQLDTFLHSVPYASLYVLWINYNELRLSYENWTDHCRSVCKALEETGLTLRDYVHHDGSAAGGLYDAVAVFLDHVSLFLHKLQHSSAAFVQSNGMGKFATKISEWLLLFEEAVEMPTNALMKQISHLCSSMANIDIDLITLASPHISETATEAPNLQAIRRNLSELVKRLCCLSHVLDDAPSGAGPTSERTDAGNSEASETKETPLISCVKRWEHHITMGLNLACETFDLSKRNILPGSNLAQFSLNSLKEEENPGAGQLAERLRCLTALPQCLRGRKVERMPRDDAVRVQCVGEDDNVYVKRFHLNTEYNLRRVVVRPLDKL
ncbi:hypothetical protein RvY_12726 [Ramazzottius varieornatus]|uniref:Uncharacterized protein n=1 Tax=Ramazzottius varieornatus TaxID=947166 RepID=A0A1D1VT38_RAMVA|nr:hypothetical protein RvY_12726 [Ramazzottius varieornatus]